MTSRARGLFALSAVIGLAGLAVALSAALVAVSRLDFALAPAQDLIAACRGWVVPHGWLASLLVLGLGSFGFAGLALVLRSALRQIRATRRFERGLRVVGHLPEDSRVRLIDDASPAAFCAGLLRPRIYLSLGATRVLSDSERRAVLAHELHHARRMDPLRFLVVRALAEGLFFLPALGRLARRHAALAELAADEAAERVTGGARALGSALLAFDAHPGPAVVGIAPERVDRLLGRPLSLELPRLLLAGAAATLMVLVAMTIGLTQAAGQASISLPLLLARACMPAMLISPLLLGAVGLVGARRLSRHAG